MLNYFCFHVYAQKSLFIGENGNDFFWTSSSSSPSPPDPLLYSLTLMSVTDIRVKNNKIVRKFSQKNNLVKEIESLRSIENKCQAEQLANKRQKSITSFLL